MDMIKEGDVWFVEFPLEENESITLNRPVVVLGVDDTSLKVLSVKVTKHEPRECDEYDTLIIHWEEAGLKLRSTARVSKVVSLSKDSFIKKIGELVDEDMDKITELYINMINNHYINKKEDIA